MALAIFNDQRKVKIEASNVDVYTFGFFSLQLNRDKIRECIGLRIRHSRREKELYVKTFVLKPGVDGANICRIEQGRYYAGFDILTKIATVLNCRIDFVLNK